LLSRFVPDIIPIPIPLAVEYNGFIFMLLKTIGNIKSETGLSQL